jgi:hypothetical protein
MESKNIHEAINAVMQEVGYVKKSRSSGVSYSFAGEAALIAAIRPAMVENGIYMHVLKIDNVTRENVTTAKGSLMTNTLITATIRFTHAQSGTFIDSASTGEGFDSGDKSANKAMTGLYKYAMRQTFCIETGDEPDKYQSEERKSSEPISKKEAVAVEEKKQAPATDEHKKLIAEWSASFNAIPIPLRGQAYTLKTPSQATDDEIRNAIAHNTKIAQEGK